MVANMKRRARSASILCERFLRFARADELPAVCVELCEMIADIQAKHVQPTSVEARIMPASLKLAPDGGCMLMDSERNLVAKQLRDARGMEHIHIYEANLLVQMVGLVISSVSACRGRHRIHFFREADNAILGGCPCEIIPVDKRSL